MRGQMERRESEGADGVSERADGEERVREQMER